MRQGNSQFIYRLAFILLITGTLFSCNSELKKSEERHQAEIVIKNIITGIEKEITNQVQIDNVNEIWNARVVVRLKSAPKFEYEITFLSGKNSGTWLTTKSGVLQKNKLKGEYSKVRSVGFLLE